ncbi:MAG: outer membrane protein assembly factor BamC [Methylococcales bacterium]|nr:outer membrane protein assembly factor BamC [Methylococcales bacterium]
MDAAVAEGGGWAMRRLSWGMVILPLLLAGCGTDPRFQDTRALEHPPALPSATADASVAHFDPAIALKSLQRGLGDKVRLQVSGQKTQLVLDASFPQAWFIVQATLQALRLSITDLDRQQGMYFVEFDPDQHPDSAGKNRSGLFARMAAWFAADTYALRNYQLSLVEHGNSTYVAARYTPDELLPGEREQTDDEQRYAQEPDDGPVRLLTLLHRALSKGLPKSAIDKKR